MWLRRAFFHWLIPAAFVLPVWLLVGWGVFQGGAGSFLWVLFIAAPLMVLAGLPAWWILGAIVRWFDSRKDKDIGQLAVEAAGLVNKVRGAA